MSRVIVLIFVFVSLLSTACTTTPDSGADAASNREAASWPQFRGPDGLAVAAEQRLPDDLGPDRHVRWKRAVDAGHSSPCVWGDRIFLTGVVDSDATVTCYSRDDGSEIWRRVFALRGAEQMMHGDCSAATPTPCTDGERVYTYFGAYGLIALDMDGDVVWEKEYPIEQNMFGTGSSPVLDGDSLYLLRDVAGLSSLYCFDAATGAERWAAPRPESSANYSSPFIWKRGDRTEIVVPGTTVLTSYDAATGEALWWVKGLTELACSSPVASGDTLYYGSWSTGNVVPERRLSTAFDPDDVPPADVLADPKKFIDHFDQNGDGGVTLDELPQSRAQDAFTFLDFNQNGTWELEEIVGFLSFETSPGRNILVAVRGGGAGDVTDTHVMWEKSKGIPYVASPLLYRDRLYYVKKGGLLTCIDASTGEPHFERARLSVGGEYYSTPVAVGDRILLGSVRGRLFVLNAADDLEIVTETDFGEGIYATPAVVDDTLYLRTTGHLYAFEDGASGS